MGPVISKEHKEKNRELYFGVKDGATNEDGEINTRL